MVSLVHGLGFLSFHVLYHTVKVETAIVLFCGGGRHSQTGVN
jgi:hypothetical protein